MQTKIPQDGTFPFSNITATPGVPVLVPLRWNNPHSSEIEVNVWVRDGTGAPFVVPIRKPVCSGEGRGDNVITFTIPNDFNNLAGKLPGWSGCNAVRGAGNPSSLVGGR